MRPFCLAPLRAFAHIDIVRRGIRDRLARWCHDPESGRHHDFAVDFYGLTYRGDLASYIDWNVYFYGAYEKHLLQLVRARLTARPGAVALDIGANVGHHALAMSRWAAEVHAFEPFPDVYRQFEARMFENGIRNVHLHQFGLGEADAVLDYYAPQGRGNLGTGSFLAAHASGYNVKHGQFAIRQADRAVAALELARLDFIKLDVEGFEPRVLAGLRETLRQFRPTILMEHSEETRKALGDLAGLMALLPPDYRARSVSGDRPVAVFFNDPRPRLEEFDFSHCPSYILLEPWT